MNALHSNFTRKWSRHTHQELNEPCNKILVLDGNWKCNRLKCAYDNVWRRSAEFGEYRVGCKNTPERLSYFCLDHKNYEMEFRKGDDVFKLKPKDIKLSRKSTICICLTEHYYTIH